MSHALASWQELSVDAAAELLAARVTVVGLRTKQAADPGMFGQMVPPAGKTLDWLNPLNDPMSEGGPNAVNKVTNKAEVDPFWGTARSGVVGAGIGAGLGGLQALMTPSRKRRWLHSLVSGALMGGGVGLGAGAAMNYGGQAVTPNKEQLLADTQAKIQKLQAVVEDPAVADAGKTQAITELTAARTELDRLGGQPTPVKSEYHDPTPEQRTAAGLPPETMSRQAGKWVGRNPEEAAARGVGGVVGAGLGGKIGTGVHDHMLWKRLQAAAPATPLTKPNFHAGMSPGRRAGRGLLGTLTSLLGGYAGQAIGGQAIGGPARTAAGPKLPSMANQSAPAGGHQEFIPNW